MEKKIYTNELWIQWHIDNEGFNGFNEIPVLCHSFLVQLMLWNFIIPWAFQINENTFQHAHAEYVNCIGIFTGSLIIRMTFPILGNAFLDCGAWTIMKIL